MAIGLTGSPQRMTPGYNPVYWYASSTETTEPDFRYLFSVYNVSTSTELADMKILPRWSDDLMEVNISKILDNDLGVFTDDLDINDNVDAFNNTPSSGFQYRVVIGEEYQYYWEFDDIIFASGKVWAIGLTPSEFGLGDAVNVSNAAEYFDFSDNQWTSGNVLGFLMDDIPPIINIGDSVTIQQDSPFTYPQYNQTFTASSITADTVIVNYPYQGGTQPEPGTLIRNFGYDGLHLVDATGQITTGAYTGYYYIEIDEAWGNDSPAHSGSIAYADGRVISFPYGLTYSDYFVFNGAAGHSEWLNWDYTPYSPFAIVDQEFLTTLPDNWCVSLDDDVFLNVWTEKFPSNTYELEVKTYDTNSVGLGTYSWLNSNSPYTEIQSVVMGPRGLNSLYPDIIQNGTFQSTSNWTTFNTNGGTASIGSGIVTYTDSVGDGEALLVQYDALIIGCEYLVTFTSLANVGVGVQIGDQSVQQTILLAGQTGTFTASFVSQQEDFYITLGSGIIGQVDGTFDDVIVQQLCPIIDCDTGSYTTQIFDMFGVTQSELRTFEVKCDCSRYTNYPILFMDRFGSFVPFDFSLNNKQKVGIKRDNYKKFIGGLNNGAYTYDTTEHSMRNYNVDLDEKWTLNTDWMTEAMSVYFEELVSSPIAFILQDNQYVAINIESKNYERKRKNNNKLRQYTIEIGMSNNNTINI